jgi:acyl-coenzyme A thioesterase PaaI-like protein
MPAGAAVLSIEFKVNLLAPGQGERFIATGRVVKPGRTVTVCAGEVEAVQGGARKTVAIMQATMMSVRDRPGLAD